MPDHALEHLEVAREGRILVITLNRPEVLNACNPTTHRELQEVFGEAEADDSVRVIVLRGAGRAFCAGSDLRYTAALVGAEARRYVQLDFATKNRIAGCNKPVIAAVHGHAVGGGFELALACDVRFAADDVKFALREVVLGTVAGAGGLQRLSRVVGLGIAKEWVISGRSIDAAEALRTGLANRVTTVEALLPETLAFAGEVAERSPLAVRLAKAALDPERVLSPAVEAFHMLASEACHNDPGFRQSAEKVTSGKADD